MSLLSLRGLLARRLSVAAPRGFTMVELLTVVVVMGTLARMAVPGVHELLVQARAAEVAADFRVVRLAVMNYHADHNEWPADGYAGQTPAGLARYLPDGFSFEGMGYVLDWENWVIPAGLPQDPRVRRILAVSVVTEDRELGAALHAMLGSETAHYSLGNTYTFVIERR